MKKRLTRISPWQAGKFAAVLYFFLGLIFSLFMALGLAFVPQMDAAPGLGWTFVLFMPLLYALAGLIFVPIGCWFFNLAAGLVGGIEFTVVESHSD